MKHQHPIENVVMNPALSRIVAGKGQDELPKSPKKSKKSAVKKSAPSTNASSKEKSGMNEFEKLLARHKVSTGIPYTTTSVFKTSDIISHPVFGVGFVKQTIPTNKIEVLFRIGSKLLICAPHPVSQLPLQDASVQTEKKKNNKNRSPSTWKAWSSATAEKDSEQWGWEDDNHSDENSSE